MSMKTLRWVNIPATLVILFLGLTTSALAAEWPAEAKAQMEAAGARLSAAATTAERVAALRDLERIAKAYPDAPQARIMARLLAEKATQEAGPAKMLAAVAELAGAGRINDVEVLGSIATPLFSAIGEMRDNGTLLPETAIQLNAAIERLDSAAAKANLPTVAEAVDQATGDTGLAAKIADAIGKIAALAEVAELARDSANLHKMNEDAKKQYIDEVASNLPLGIAEAAFVPFRDNLVWNSEMFDESTKALDLVTQAIETGRFDHRAYARIERRLNELSKGPWSSSTALDFFERLCEKIPIAKAWCGDAFKLAEKLIGVDCGSIDCDCDNIKGGLMRGPLIVQCKLQEQDLIEACQAQKKIVGSCLPDARGPAANPK